MTQAEPITEDNLHADAEAIIATLRKTVASGGEWFPALMRAVRDWPLPSETVGDRDYAYLVGGEAFDWLLLAERLLTEIEDLVPEEEAEALLFDARLPVEAGEDELKRLLGAKYKAHLNFVWGVRVESALQLAVACEVHKEHQSRVWENGHADDEVYTRIYGKPRAEMFAEYHLKTSAHPEACPELGRRALEGPASDGLTLAGLNEFTYWLFRYRLNNSDPAKVASDTRKGVAHLERLDAIRLRDRLDVA